MGRKFFLSVINRCDIRIRIGGLVARIRQQRNAGLVIRIRAQRGIDGRKTNRGLEIENRTCLSITLLGRTPPAGLFCSEIFAEEFSSNAGLSAYAL